MGHVQYVLAAIKSHTMKAEDTSFWDVPPAVPIGPESLFILNYG